MKPNYNIFLTDEQATIFDKFSESDSAILTREEYSLLNKHNLLVHSIDGKSDFFDLPDKGICELNDFGKSYREYRAKQIEKQKSEKKDKSLSNLRSWITTITAVLGFILSIISLFWQYELH